MLSTVEVRTDSGALLQLPLGDTSQGYALVDVEGLDPVKATLVSSSFAELDGAQFQSSRREARNLVFTIIFDPDYATQNVETLRKNLYSYFMPERRVYLRFINDSGLTVNITGRVESFNAKLFTEEPEATITVVCFNPDFSELNSITLNGNTVSTSTETLVEYAGSVETGIEFVLNVNRTLTEFTIYSRAEDNVIRSLQFAGSLVAGDVLTISTIAGAKGATLLRSSVESSYLYGVSPFANWINFFPGDNYYRVYAEGAAIPYTIEYTNKYGAL